MANLICLFIINVCAYRSSPALCLAYKAARGKLNEADDLIQGLEDDSETDFATITEDRTQVQRSVKEN